MQFANRPSWLMTVHFFVVFPYRINSALKARVDPEGKIVKPRSCEMKQGGLRFHSSSSAMTDLREKTIAVP